MKVHIENEIRSRGIERIVAALEAYKPTWVEIVPHEEADIVVIQVNGRLRHLERKVARYGKPYALFQHSLRSSMNPDPADWKDIWKGASLVWTFYDLPIDNLYHTPLGVSGTFRRPAVKRDYIICTSGLSYLTESVRECILAARGIGRVLHLGPNIARGYEHVDCVQDLSDEELADLYSRCEFVSGLRRIEGFELPAAEGLLCGARPILFDRNHYRRWYDGLGEFIHEGDRNEVERSVRKIFLRTPRAVGENEKDIAAKRFDWGILVHGFYDNLRART